MTTLTHAIPSPHFAAIKAKQQATWASGDFAVIGTTLQIVGEDLAEAVDLRAGERVIDVAAGNGNATLAAARRFAQVTSTDYVPELLQKGAARAAAEGLSVYFKTADAEDLPFEEESFDVALSTFGVMFAPDAHRCASELVRVVRRGGRIGLASWTPSGFLGDLFKVVGSFVPPPAGVASPMQWGDEARIEALFAPHGRIDMRRRIFNFRYVSAAHWVQVFRDFYGPTHKAFAALDEGGQRKLNDALTDLLERANVGGPASLVVPAEYLEVVVTLD
ncbi:class I SAM-dependent methyltransferase [Caenimonas aquaedulcis]|uniref:Class I SAM-dependent methyltransferase n=1 Tax=Caenimonas aquaedulcis TaxID=2793270 RepID=A0A931H6A3_9BURK|nr:class I SAM-dependent methyltransferase [Caenimonas aquaedulcis]MBG9389440.1 class I SAM-dependent methyltransferase [Caenimonas aquaedulcis]